jgi:DNA-binding MurR/RpiR family transcriptional regulator
MIGIDETKLNPLERTVVTALAAHAKDHPAPKIVEAAAICSCSVSQVSKAVKRAGFGGYKHYMRFLYHGESPQQTQLQELDRIKQFIDEFDTSLVDDFVELIKSHAKIVFFGYGPSHICAQYVEYKLRFCTDAFVTTPPDEASVRNMVDDESLLVILTTTGQYRSFHDVSLFARGRGTDVVVVSEEFNSHLMDECDRYVVLSNHRQPDELKPHQKTRTVFFVFFEQVIQQILTNRRARGITE